MLPDVTSLLRLRAAVRRCNGDDVGLPHEAIAELARLRADAATAVRDADAEAFSKLCWGVWELLGKLDELSCPYALPPPYPTKEVLEAWRWAAGSLLALERGRRPVGDNTILRGIKGAGKTTLLQAVAAVAAVLLERTIPIYHSYEHLHAGVSPLPPTIGTLLDSAAQTIASDTLAPSDRSEIGGSSKGEAAEVDMGVALATLRGEATLSPDERRAPLLLIEGFTELYVNDSDDAPAAVQEFRARGQATMRELHWLCKGHTNVMALLTTSKTNLDRYMCPRETPALFGYPDINNSIFIRRSIKPIRNALELQAYAEKRFGGLCKVDGPTLLDATGGVGSLVASYHCSDGHAAPVLPVEDILRSRELFALHCAILASVPADQSTSEAWPPYGIPTAEATRILAVLGRSEREAARLTDEYCDRIVFFSNVHMLEVLVPSVLRAFKRAVDADDDLVTACDLVAAIHGFRGVGADLHSNEIIYRHIHKALDLPRSSSSVLLLDGGTARWVHGIDGSGKPSAACATVDELVDCSTAWGIDGSASGIDRFWLTDLGGSSSSAGGARCLQVNGLQLKTGKAFCERSIAPGNLSAERRKPTRALDDNSIAGMLVKAERDFAKLLPALHACFPGVVWSLGSLVIFSTKPATDAAVKFREGHALAAEAFPVREVPERKAITDSGALGLAAAADEAFPVSFAWGVVDGLDWIRGMVPPAVARVL